MPRSSLLPTSLAAKLAPLAAATLLAACAQPQNPEDIDFSTTGGIHDGGAADGGMGGEVGDDGADETGDPGPTLVDGCLSKPQTDGTFGFRHQCLGEINIELHANVAAQGAVEIPIQVLFGEGEEGDSYAAPRVMACCHPLPVPSPPGFFTFETLTPEPHYKACYRDMLEQMCMSIPFRLYDFADELAADNHPIAANQATKLGNHMAENTQACADAFIDAVEDYDPDIEEDFLRLQGSFTVEDSSEWGLITDIEFIMGAGEGPSSVIFDLFLPEEEEDWATCESDNDNNDFLFTEASVEPPVVELASGSATLDGPVIGHEAVEGASSLASRATNCDRCSSVSFGSDQVDVWISSMELIVEDPTEVGTSANSMLVDRVRVLLYTAETLTFTSSTEAYVPAGDALFLLSAFAEGEAGSVSAYNDGPIEVEFLTGGDVIISPFDIGYTESSREWTLSFSTLTFEP